MTQEKIKQIHRIYGWVLTALMIAVGVLLVLSCLDIYFSGPRPYSTESIAQHFSKISIPIYITLIGVLGGIGIHIFLPLESKRPKSPQRDHTLLLRLREKTGILDPAQQFTVRKEIRLRRILRIATAVHFVALMIFPAVYFLSRSNFTVSNLNADIVKAVLIVMIPALLGLSLCFVCRIICSASMRREIQCYKQALAAGNKSTPKKHLAQNSNKKRIIFKWSLRGVLLAAAAVLIVVGICNGGMDDVLKKAIAICTECIGLG